MPNVYTVILEEKEVTFEEFVLRCARGMWQLSMMEGQPLDAPIPQQFQAPEKELEEARQRLAEIQSWDEEKAEREAEKAYQKAIQERNKIIAQDLQLRQRYEKILAQVQAWIPPTPNHRKLKQFMIEQIEGSIKSDCEYIPEEPKRLSGTEYKKQLIAEVQQQIEGYEKKIERIKATNNWLRALRESLCQPGSKK